MREDKAKMIELMGADTRLFRECRRRQLACVNFAVLQVMARRRAEGDRLPLSTGEVGDMLGLKLNNAMKQLRYLEGKGLVRHVGLSKLREVFAEQRWHPRYFYWHLTSQGGQLVLDIYHAAGLNE